MAFDRDSQAVKFVKPNVFYRACLAVGENDSLADEFSLRRLERAEDR